MLLFATSNTHKLLEAQEILGSETPLRSLADMGFAGDIPETGMTLEENALLKATYVWGKYTQPCFADDTGLEAEGLGGAPGVYSARYAGEPSNHEKNVKLLLKNLQDIENRRACFRTVVTYIDAEGVHQFEGIVRGTIAPRPSGMGGFGYDPIFIPEGFTSTFADMSSELKNSISHRGEALRKLAHFLRFKNA